MPTIMSRRGAIDKVSMRRKLLKRYVDLAFALEDQIMVSTKLGTAATCSVVDYFTFFLATPITKGVEGAAMTSVRVLRKHQASALYAAINTLPEARLQVLVSLTNQQSGPGFDWLRNQINASPSAAGSAAAATVSAAVASVSGISGSASVSGISGSASVSSSGAASAAASTVASTVTSTVVSTTVSVAQDIFVDYIADAITDQLAALAPGGLGTIKASVQVGLVSTRVNELKAQIALLKNMAA